MIFTVKADATTSSWLLSCITGSPPSGFPLLRLAEKHHIEPGSEDRYPTVCVGRVSSPLAHIATDGSACDFCHRSQRTRCFLPLHLAQLCLLYLLSSRQIRGKGCSLQPKLGMLSMFLMQERIWPGHQSPPPPCLISNISHTRSLSMTSSARRIKTKLRKSFKPPHPIFFKHKRSSVPFGVSSWSREDITVPPVQAAEPSHKIKDTETFLHGIIFLLATARSSHVAQEVGWYFFPMGCLDPGLSEPNPAASSRSRAGCPRGPWGPSSITAFPQSQPSKVSPSPRRSST